MAIVWPPGYRGLGRLPVNYSRRLLREIPPIELCGRLRHLRFAFFMHDDGDVCVGGGRARVLVGTRATCSVAFAVATLALAVVPRRSWRRWRSCCWGSMDHAWLGLLDDQ